MIVCVGGIFERVYAGPRQLELGLVVGKHPGRGIDGGLHRVLAQHLEA